MSEELTDKFRADIQISRGRTGKPNPMLLTICANDAEALCDRLAAAESSAAQALRELDEWKDRHAASVQSAVNAWERTRVAEREREVLEGALRKIVAFECMDDANPGVLIGIAKRALASLPSPEPTQPTTECAFPGCDCPGEFPVCEDFPAHLRNPLDPHGTAPEPTQGEQ